MTYQDLLIRVAETSELPIELVRHVLSALPEGLNALAPGEKVRTPLGVFRLTERKARQVRAPGATGPKLKIPAEMVVKLRAGRKLRRKP